MKKDKVLVDRDSLPRCGWCGSYYSPDWFQIALDEPVFCSSECWSASSIRLLESEILQSKGATCFTGSLTIFCVISIILAPNAAPIWFGVMFFSLCCFCTGIGISKRNEEARMYLYRKGMYRDIYHFQLECDFCSHLNPPDALDCQHCDASLRESRPVKGDIPQWFESKSPLPQKTCPHCGVVYVYEQGYDGTFTCQNCGKSFNPKS